jgi:hypothetical protein
VQSCRVSQLPACARPVAASAARKNSSCRCARVYHTVTETEESQCGQPYLVVMLVAAGGRDAQREQHRGPQLHLSVSQADGKNLSVFKTGEKVGKKRELENNHGAYRNLIDGRELVLGKEHGR